MKVFHALPLLLALGLLAACDEPPKPPSEAPRKQAEARPEKSAPTPPPPAAKKAEEKPAPKPAPAPPKPTKPAPKPAAKSAVSPAVKVPLPPVKLDLHLPEELVQGLEPGEPVEPPKPVLPPMFMEKPTKPGPYQLNGRLITNDRGDDYWDSVEGAELQIEFRN
ncbi:MULTISPECIES: hypothetical protein [unclassified Pseudomonas]|uniref:hypothetical protein n=1 Tax=unclassified Pseudomonas TaxID=196821 RepID=UPI00244D53D4|nr:MULTISPECIES: hypothetical protein [unclassified Pseudomonas]MDH0893775.1 hypothetical protein [Pseudomonas sp. GD03875]MDH1066998.1 hypothetical protein [Pseudomonas sp. GD03985]